MPESWHESVLHHEVLGRSEAEGALKPAETVNIEDVDAVFLANIDEDRVYRIEYFKRYGGEYTQEPV